MAKGFYEEFVRQIIDLRNMLFSMSIVYHFMH